MKTHICHSRHIFYEFFCCDRSIITGSVLEEQCLLLTVSSLSLEVFSLRAISGTPRTLIIGEASLVAIGQELSTLLA